MTVLSYSNKKKKNIVHCDAAISDKQGNTGYIYFDNDIGLDGIMICRSFLNDWLLNVVIFDCI